MMSEAPKKRAPRKPKNSGENTGTPTKPKQIPQPHGGALNSGGVPGNKGGTGRPPNEVRALAREGGWTGLQLIKARLDQLEKLHAEGKELPWSQVNQLSDLMLKYGLGERTEHMFPGGMPFAAELSQLPEEDLDAQLRDAESREAP